MKKKISVLALSSILIVGTACASGFRIPEQSVDSVAKAGANIASASHADASYFNPANMAWLKDTWQFDGALTYINLSSVTYTDNRSPLMNGDSNVEQFFLPTFFVVSPDYNNFRFGISGTAPFGLSKRWQQPFPKSTAQEYTLNMFELNPTVSYTIGDKFSLAGGVRMVYSKAKVANYAVQRSGVMVTRFADVDTTEWGYNLAASVRPNDAMNISATYRSKIDLDLEGDITMGTNTPSFFSMATQGSAVIPTPAVLSVSLAYTFGAATVDLTWDRTFWSAYESIGMEYNTPVTHPVLHAVYTEPIVKNWDDSSAYRIGLDYDLNKEVTLMAGFAFDETPVPDATLGFDLPDSNAYLYSFGGRYRVSEAMEIGMAYLFDYKESRKVVNGSATSGINGEFTNSAAHMLTVGLSYDF